MSPMSSQMTEERFDVTARHFHQWVVVALTLVAFVLNSGWVMLFVALVMLVGRFRDEGDLFRGFYSAVLVPAGLLAPRMVVEDRATRRIARVLGVRAVVAQRTRSRLGGTPPRPIETAHPDAPTVLYFYGKACAACATQRRALRTLSARHPDLNVVSVDTARERGLAEWAGVL